jgi:addiction module HigA family antidote
VPTTTETLAPLHPGEVLRKEFLISLGMPGGALAEVCGVPRTRIERLANEKSGVTADTALRLSKAFGTTAALWPNLQNDFDLRMAKHQIGKDLDKIYPGCRDAGLERKKCHEDLPESCLRRGRGSSSWP